MSGEQIEQQLNFAFVIYFKKEWLDSHVGWYEGYSELTPSTNNALEATNRYIKDNGTFRARLDISLFLSTSKKILHNWSYDRNPANINCSKFIKEKSELSIKEWTNGY